MLKRITRFTSDLFIRFITWFFGLFRWPSIQYPALPRYRGAEVSKDDFTWTLPDAHYRAIRRAQRRQQSH